MGNGGRVGESEVLGLHRCYGNIEAGLHARGGEVVHVSIVAPVVCPVHP